jgi:hypothetical protein
MVDASTDLVVNMSDKFIISADCKYLQKGYPFRLVYFKKVNDGYTAFLTPENWPDMNQADRSLFPVVENIIQTPGGPIVNNRRNGFFGVINTEELLQPHEFNYNEIEGIKICEEGGKTFMIKGNYLRMPLKAILPGLPYCSCLCGNTRPININYGVSGAGGIDGRLANEVYKVTVPFGAFTGQTVTKQFQEIRGFGLGTQTHTWTYISSIIVGFFSPQHTPYCPFAAPPVFTHSVCPVFEMAEIYFFTMTFSAASYDVLPLFSFPIVIYDYYNISDPMLGSKIGETCYARNEIIFLLSGGGGSANVGPGTVTVPSQPTFSDLPPGTPLPSFPPWEVNPSISLGDVLGSFPSCTNCYCRDIPSQYVPTC